MVEHRNRKNREKVKMKVEEVHKIRIMCLLVNHLEVRTEAIISFAYLFRIKQKNVIECNR